MTDVPFLPDYPATLPNVIADTANRYADREFLVMGDRRSTSRSASWPTRAA